MIPESSDHQAPLAAPRKPDEIRREQHEIRKGARGMVGHLLALAQNATSAERDKIIQKIDTGEIAAQVHINYAKSRTVPPPALTALLRDTIYEGSSVQAITVEHFSMQVERGEQGRVRGEIQVRPEREMEDMRALAQRVAAGEVPEWEMRLRMSPYFGIAVPSPEGTRIAGTTIKFEVGEHETTFSVSAPLVEDWTRPMGVPAQGTGTIDSSVFRQIMGQIQMDRFSGDPHHQPVLNMDVAMSLNGLIAPGGLK